MLTRDVLIIILKDLIKIERKEIEHYVMKNFAPFRTLEQIMFAVDFELSECDSNIQICFNCEAFILTQKDEEKIK